MGLEKSKFDLEDPPPSLVDPLMSSGFVYMSDMYHIVDILTLPNILPSSLVS